MTARAKALGSLILVGLVSACEQAAEAPAEDVSAPQATSVQEAAQAAYEAYVGNFGAIPCDNIAPIDNEVHDCQRLVREAGPNQLEFGPLVGILPMLDVAPLPEADYDSPQMVALTSNAGSLSGNHDYPPLEIIAPATPDTTVGQCLWLRRRPQSPPDSMWQAALTPHGDGSGPRSCVQPSSENEWSSLRVVRQTYGGAPLGVYPNTARWQWTGEDGALSGEHYIGVKCGAGWCTVGSTSFQPVAIPDPDDEIATQAIPGWHDKQFLGVMHPPGSPNAEITPGPWGVIYPEPVPSKEHPDWPTGIRAATFELTPTAGPAGGVGPYVTKLNLSALHQSWVEVSWNGDEATDPQARYRNAPNDPGKPAVTVETAPFPHGASMSARWKWHDEDESAWAPCPHYGCCDIREAN